MIYIVEGRLTSISDMVRSCSSTVMIAIFYVAIHDRVLFFFLYEANFGDTRTFHLFCLFSLSLRLVLFCAFLRDTF